MFRRQTHESRPEHRIMPSGKDRYDLFGTLYGESDLGAQAFTDPVLLHGENLVRPSRELITMDQQVLGII